MKRLLIATIILATAGFGCTYSKWKTLPVDGHNISTGPQGGTIVPPDPTPTPVITPSSACGNGVLEAGEQCDDGNVLAGDGCSDTCQIEVAVTPPPPPAVCKKGVADGACSDSSECCGVLTCYSDCHTGSSFCGLEPPPTCGGTGGVSGCTADQDCSDPNTQMCNSQGQCVPRPQPSHVPPAKCTVVGQTDSCPNGSSCNLQTGQCDPWVRGKDFCMGDQDCPKGWTCPEQGDSCQPPAPPPTPTCATPSAYTDGRTPVPLIVTAYKDLNASGQPSGIIARFVKDTPYVALNDQISGLKIYKGPNYVDGYQVAVYRDGNFQHELYRFGPGAQTLGGYTADSISSIKIIPPANLPTCADPADPQDKQRWTQKIPLVVEIFEDANYGGMSEQLITDASDLTKWGMKDDGVVCTGKTDGCWSWNDEISSLRLSKGPDYQSGDFVRLFKDGEGMFPPQGSPPQTNPYMDESIGQVNDYHYVGDILNDEISSLYLFYGNENHMGLGDPEGY